MVDIGKRLKLLRIERGKLQREVAAGVGLSTSYVAALEEGKRKAPVVTLEKFAQYYGVSLMSLLGDDVQAQGSSELAKVVTMIEVARRALSEATPETAKALTFIKEAEDILREHLDITTNVRLEATCQAESNPPPVLSGDALLSHNLDKVLLEGGQRGQDEKGFSLSLATAQIPGGAAGEDCEVHPPARNLGGNGTFRDRRLHDSAQLLRKTQRHPRRARNQA